MHKIKKTLNEKFCDLDSRISSSEKKNCVKRSRITENLRSEIFSLHKLYDELKEKFEDADDQIEDLQEEVVQLKRELAKERERCNHLEQYQRRECLCFLGVGPNRGRAERQSWTRKRQS